jgi:hypothetical protein
MIYQRVNRTDPEKVFLVVKNSYSTGALANGYAVIWDFYTDGDGVGVTKPTARATNAGFAFAGIAAETIAAGSYGLIQIYGYHSAALTNTMTGSTVKVAKGAPLALNAAGGEWSLESYATGTRVVLVYPGAVALGAQALFTPTATAIFIKAM